MSALAALIAEHAYRPSAARGVERCTCGWSEVGSPGGHADHLAAVLTGAGYGDLAAERERIATAIEAHRDELRTIGVAWRDGGPLVDAATIARAARDIEPTP